MGPSSRQFGRRIILSFSIRKKTNCHRVPSEVIDVTDGLDGLRRKLLMSNGRQRHEDITMALNGRRHCDGLHHPKSRRYVRFHRDNRSSSCSLRMGSIIYTELRYSITYIRYILYILVVATSPACQSASTAAADKRPATRQ